MHLKNKRIFISFLFLTSVCLSPTKIWSQINDRFGNQAPINLDQDTSYSPEDTIINKNSFFTLFKGKPGRAAFYSLVIPGGGQLYNRKYWKFPLAVAIDGGVTYWLVYNRQKYKLYQAQLETALLANPRPPDTEQIRQVRNGFRKRQEYAWIILIGGHLLPVLDAYVDRHLLDFDISPDLGQDFDHGGSLIPSYVGVTFSYYLDK